MPIKAKDILARRIAKAYGREEPISPDYTEYVYCGARLDKMSRAEVILALTRFKIPTDGLG